MTQPNPASCLVGVGVGGGGSSGAGGGGGGLQLPAHLLSGGCVFHAVRECKDLLDVTRNTPNGPLLFPDTL